MIVREELQAEAFAEVEYEARYRSAGSISRTATAAGGSTSEVAKTNDEILTKKSDVRF
jgi:hypothetical protein